MYIGIGIDCYPNIETNTGIETSIREFQGGSENSKTHDQNKSIDVTWLWLRDLHITSESRQILDT